MKRSKLNYALLLSATMLFAASCSKDKDELSRTELLSGKAWSQTKTELSYKGTTTDVTEDELDECDKDDILTFAKNGTYTYSVGADDCSGDSEDETGTWSLINGEKTLRIVTSGDDPDTTEVTIVSVSSSNFKLSFDVEFDIDGDGKDDAGIKYINTYTVKK